MSTDKKKNKGRKQSAEEKLAVRNETRQWITIVILVAFCAIGLMRAGKAGTFIYNVLRYLFGGVFWLILLLMALWQLISIASTHKDEEDARNPLPIILIILDIELLEAGDLVYITNLWGTLTYRVTEIQIINPNEIDAILIRPGKDMITLLTCHPYGSGGLYRYLVFCERV